MKLAESLTFIVGLALLIWGIGKIISDQKRSKEFRERLEATAEANSATLLMLEDYKEILKNNAYLLVDSVVSPNYRTLTFEKGEYVVSLSCDLDSHVMGVRFEHDFSEENYKYLDVEILRNWERSCGSS